jgi:hypothetical protein
MLDIIALINSGLPAIVAKYPLVLHIMGIMTVARLIFKPLFSFLNTFVLATPSPRDDEILAKVMNSGVYKAISYVLDLSLSIKLPQLDK